MPEKYPSILLFGPPGVGKGTQGQMLGSIPGFFHLATGDMFRSLDKESEIGMEFTRYSSQGLLVPDFLTVRLWRQHVDQLIARELYNPTSDILLLDGIPRSVPQAESMNEHVNPIVIMIINTNHSIIGNHHRQRYHHHHHHQRHHRHHLF